MRGVERPYNCDYIRELSDEQSQWQTGHLGNRANARWAVELASVLGRCTYEHFIVDLSIRLAYLNLLLCPLEKQPFELQRHSRHLLT